jgi:hypothetical protein
VAVNPDNKVLPVTFNVFAVNPELNIVLPDTVPPLNGRYAPEADELPVYADRLIVNAEYCPVLFCLKVMVLLDNVNPVTNVSVITGKLRYVVADNVVAVRPLTIILSKLPLAFNCGYPYG